MTDANLDQLQRTYKEAIEAWVTAIRSEEALASVEHSVTRLDRWEQAHLEEEKLRDRALAAKKEYENALRKAQFGF